MFKEFKKFALRGNVIDLAIGIVIGSAFTTIVNSLVNDLLLPPIGMILGGVDFENFYFTLESGAPAGPYTTLAEAQQAGAVTLNYGLFINAVVSFLIIAFALFLIIRGVNQMQREKEKTSPAPTTKECPYCLSTIPLNASRCPHCTSQL